MKQLDINSTEEISHEVLDTLITDMITGILVLVVIVVVFSFVHEMYKNYKYKKLVNSASPKKAKKTKAPMEPRVKSKPTVKNSQDPEDKLTHQL